VTGFRHPQYAQSLREVGAARELPLCRGWILERSIADSPYRDAMGCYPLFSCYDWSQLHRDIDDLGDGLVSVALVTDPFGDYDESYLRRCFRDTVVPFKEHYVIDLDRTPREVVSKHHRYYARKALREVSVHVHDDPTEYIDEWMELHQHLVDKHGIEGVRRFSRSAFAEQLTIPGMVVLRAVRGQEPVAAMLYFVQDDVVFAHVLGCSEIGYELGALYAILWSAIEHFGDTARWLDIMGVPGVADKGAEGIRQFKRGWSRETRMAWFCGRILNPARYTELVRATDTSQSTYFPSYRHDEMG
jgi:GNAT acetyltransferase-like protein